MTLAKGTKRITAFWAKQSHAKLGTQLRLGDAKTESLAFLIRHHLDMSLIAFRRDTSDLRTNKIICRALRNSPQNLSMLFVLTCADMAAVGPGVLNDWKIGLLADLHDLTLHWFSNRQPKVSDRREASPKLNMAIA